MADKAQENVTDETRLQAIREATIARRRAQAVAGEAGAVVKKWQKAGVNPVALRMVVRLRDADPDEVVDLLRELVRMLSLIQIPLNQTEMFPVTPEPLAAKVIEEQDEFEAFDAGYLAGKAARPLHDNPYGANPGSILFVKWRQGWDKGQEDNAWALNPEAKPVDAEPKSRAKKGEAKGGEEKVH